MTATSRVLAAFAICLPAFATVAQAAEAPRVEVPIRAMMQPDGTPRYSIMITVGGTPVEGELDSGSVGVRILPGTLAAGSFTPTKRAETYSYGSGAEYVGVIATAPIEIGGLKSANPAPFQAIETFGCTKAKPSCPVSKVAAKDYGIAGGGVVGQGFKAIIGINMADAPAANPLFALGVKSWIIILPKLGDKTPGSLILNPNAADTAGFVRIPVQPRFSRSDGGLHDAIWGCLTNSNTKLELCGPFLFDTGGDGVAIMLGQGKSDAPWGPGVNVRLTLGTEDRQPMSANFLTGQNSPSRLRFNPGQGQPNTRFMAGPLPYYAFNVLYDSATQTVALKPK